LSSSEILATAPAGTGTVNIQVKTAGGRSAVTRADQYRYVKAPSVTRVSPATGQDRGGTLVTIAGTGFGAGDQVAFGTAPASSVTVLSATRIIAVSPPGSGAVDIRVAGLGGLSAARTADIFGYPAKPRFTSPASASGHVGKAFTFTIRASGYPFAAITWKGTLPGGLRARQGKNGTTVISGKPAKAGRFVLRLVARNKLGTARQTLTITVRKAS
jgi:hypothetical protein